jgi:hypothetical protein
MEAAKVGMTDHNILAVAIESLQRDGTAEGQGLSVHRGMQPTWLR